MRRFCPITMPSPREKVWRRIAGSRVIRDTHLEQDSFKGTVYNISTNPRTQELPLRL